MWKSKKVVTSRVLLALALVLTLVLVACGGESSSNNDEANPLTATGLIQAFIDAGLPLIHIIEYTSETDTNSLLGRPGEYVEKINWFDGRYFEDWMGEESPNLTVEVFLDREDMERRKAHIQSMMDAMPILSSPYFYSDTMLLRLSFDLTPESTSQYEEVFRAFLAGETVVLDINTTDDVSVSFSDTEIMIEFISIALSISEDIRYSSSDSQLWLYFSDDSLPMGMFTMEGTTDGGLTENDVNTFLNNVGDQFQYDGGPVSWSDIEHIAVNNLQISLSETQIDGEIFNIDETLNITTGIFVAGHDVFSIMFVAAPQMYHSYLPHFRAILNTIETIEVPTIEQAQEPIYETTQTPERAQTPTTTPSQRNAIGSAEQFLQVSSFSRSSLISQLEFGGFSNEDATFAVDNITVDWYEQAVRSADGFLAVSAFSRTSLIDQLVFGGFTQNQATHAVDNIEVDWYEQAYRSANSFLAVMPLSRSALIDQLVFGGFTSSQATQAVDRVGL